MALAATALVATTCGLETVVVLEPPFYQGATSAGEGFFRFEITNKNNESEFRGVELYYRLYPQGASVDYNLQSLTEVVSAGFFRMASDQDTPTQISKPLLEVHPDNRPPVTSTVPAILTLQIDENTDPVPYDNTTSLTVEPDVTQNPTQPSGSFAVRRGVADASGKYKLFDDFEAGDSDIKSLGGAANYPNVRMVVYAFSYGKQNLSTELYSEAVYVEYVDFLSLIVE